MARTRTVKTSYKPVKVKGLFGRTRQKLAPKSKTVTSKRFKSKPSDLEVINSMTGKDQLEAFKSYQKGRTHRAIANSISGTSLGSEAIIGTATSAANRAASAVSSIGQNINGGISGTKTSRDDDDNPEVI